MENWIRNYLNPGEQQIARRMEEIEKKCVRKDVAPHRINTENFMPSNNRRHNTQLYTPFTWLNIWTFNNVNVLANISILFRFIRFRMFLRSFYSSFRFLFHFFFFCFDRSAIFMSLILIDKCRIPIASYTWHTKSLSICIRTGKEKDRE